MADIFETTVGVIVTIISIILFILLLKRRTSKGTIGEKRVAHILKRLPNYKYRVINNLLIPNNNGHTTQIDHIVISVYGIFVIETKTYQGWIYGGENSDYWTQNIYGNKYGTIYMFTLHVIISHTLGATSSITERPLSFFRMRFSDFVDYFRMRLKRLRRLLSHALEATSSITERQRRICNRCFTTFSMTVWR